MTKSVRVKCPTCGLELTKGHLQRHIRAKHKTVKKSHICSVCNKAFLEKSDLTQHKKRHTEDRTFSCGTCHSKFKTAPELKAHVANVHERERVACNQCGQEVTKGHLQRHMRAKHSDAPKTHVCNICDRAFLEKENLTQHMIVHSEESSFPCDTCGATFKRDKDRRSHVSNVHLGERVTCNTCGEKVTKGHLQRHMRAKHDNAPKTHVCNICDKAFLEKDNLTQHMMVHSEERPFKCKSCETSFKCRRALKIHKKVVHDGKREVCPFEGCQTLLSSKGHVQRHIKVVHYGKREVCPFQGCESFLSSKEHVQRHIKAVHLQQHRHDCPYPSCTFSSCEKSCVQRHVKAVHQNIRDYVCEECGFGFTSGGKLKRHQQVVHEGLRPWSCPECLMTFGEAAGMKRHLALHEKQKKWTIVCNFAHAATHKAREGDIVCGTRVKHLRDLELHIEKCHTPEGLAKKFKSEDNLATYFDQVALHYDRDFQNTLNFKECSRLQLEGCRARPDFFLTELSSKLNCIVLVGCDEYAHRDRQVSCELARMSKISGTLFENPDVPKRMVYVRFNPHWFTMDDETYDPPLQERYQKLSDTLATLTPPETGVQVLYLYYDLQGGQLKWTQDHPDLAQTAAGHFQLAIPK